MANYKISKVAKDLNIALPTVIEFLQSKGINIDMNPNARIDESAYGLLMGEYSSDKAEKSKSEKLSSDRQKERATRPAKETASEPQEIKIGPAVRPTVVGHIDLDSKGEPVRHKTEHKPEPKTEPKPEPKATPAQAQAEKAESAPVKQETPVSQPAPAPKPVETPVKPQAPVVEKTTPAPVAEPRREQRPEQKPVETPAKEKESETQAPTQPDKEKSASTPKTEPQKEPQAPIVTPVQKEELPKTEVKKEEPEVFTTPGSHPAPQLNVIGKIDLSAINQSTRPRRKTKEERRNERNAKAAGAGATGTGANAAAGQGKKRRNRIGKEKVDIEKTSNQQQPGQNRGGNNNSRGGNNGGNNNNANGRNRDNAKGKDRNRRNAPQQAPASEEDVQKQVKETLARLINKDKGQKKGVKWRKEKREAFHSREREAAEAEAAESRVLKLTEFVTANDLAVMMDVPINEVIATCMNLGVMVSINQRLDAETINIVAEEFGFQTEYVSAEVVEAIHQEEDNEEDLVNRPPIVTVMGHVDHGKTSLLDYIRNANVIAGEAGGITQHIGAYNVKLEDGRRITFLDTPGHEAFTAMRARGAKVTDLCIIIVAADDNVMPQTVEAINHASAAGVPIVFAINKIDKPAANPDKIKEELAQMNYLVEEWGGKYQSQDVSAKKGLGVNELMEKVLLEAEMLDLKANPSRPATGSIIESSLDKGRGYVATVLVQNGTLRVGDIVLAGSNYGKVKAMFNERNQRVKEAGPATPVLILGLNGAPQAGDTFNVMPTEQEAREIANKREQLQRELGLRTNKRIGLEEIGRRRAIGNFHELNIIVKGDVDGSIEALSDSLIKLSTEEVKVNVLHKAVGAISESDVALAAASDALIIGFQVRPSQAARRAAERDGVEIRLYSVIYQAIEEVKDAMEGMLAPEIKEEVIGTAEVLQVYKISKVGTIAGAIVREGKIKRSCKVRLIRDGIVRYTGELGSLKRFKDDVKEVLSGYDCGLSIAGYNDIQEGDFIEAFEEVEVKKTL
ncbi:translation initiation factor IF-2 [Muribaculum intestinale]|uniref:Translation initiation factor IF-2 n=6 Tax=Muribaculum intestinale TaxID=1796646 RepID=A0A1B1SB40_9BACT|nr:translation initiation factor IF-2 [Muribaculum intestinale]ROS79895.1 translation initiation factor IF-2 [Muribaculaceae bacterium Isolate-042 (Harlan)]ANU64011.1 translation initiation factor IF-2 [Muribaculum intestinale]ASB37893.1 translation initiation factor IF-2 [Muribaculum intestinale]MYM12780.1 translation initiation factor IF-2 [Muribaculum intestinale]PWB01170.1 translation initiation factor IF-2 [Muribaculum intestinale]